MTEYEKMRAAKRKADEYERQATAFKLSDVAPMGTLNKYIEAMQMRGELSGAGGVLSTQLFKDPGSPAEALGGGGAKFGTMPGGVSGLGAGGTKQRDVESEFATKYGGTPKEMLSGLEEFRRNPQAVNPYSQLQSRYKAQETANIDLSQAKAKALREGKYGALVDGGEVPPIEEAPAPGEQGVEEPVWRSWLRAASGGMIGQAAGGLPPAVAPAAGKKILSLQDKQAQARAMQNPNDPRAAAINKRLGR
jgi:hypothetical protein